MAPSLIVMVKEAVVVSATHGHLYLLTHCTVGTMGKYCLLLMEMEMETTEQTLQFFYFCIFDE